MAGTAAFPAQRPGTLYLTEGGIETELMYRWGFDLPQFAMYPLLDNPAAMDTMRGMYRRLLDVAARHGMGALMGGLDYRASPDWAALLGYSAAGLEEANLRSIDFLRGVAAEYAGQVDDILVQGFVGPRGDAYALNRTITEAEAEDYHAVQLATLAKAGVDLAWGFTLNNVAEATGIVRAASRLGVPVAISLTLDADGRLKSGPSLRDAIAAIDAATDGSAAFFSINCSHPDEFAPALEPGDWIARVRGLRPNASRMDKGALCQIGYLEEGDPVELGQQAGALARRYPHMDIWGGCCGCIETHLEEIARNVVAAHAA